MKVCILRAFRAVPRGESYPVSYEPGDADLPDDVAETALQEGWARPLSEEPDTGPQPPDSGPDQPSSSSQPVPASATKTYRRRGRPRKTAL